MNKYCPKRRLCDPGQGRSHNHWAGWSGAWGGRGGLFNLKLFQWQWWWWWWWWGWHKSLGPPTCPKVNPGSTTLSSFLVNLSYSKLFTGKDIPLDMARVWGQHFHLKGETNLNLGFDLVFRIRRWKTLYVAILAIWWYCTYSVPNIICTIKNFSKWRSSGACHRSQTNRELLIKRLQTVRFRRLFRDPTAPTISQGISLATLGWITIWFFWRCFFSKSRNVDVGSDDNDVAWCRKELFPPRRSNCSIELRPVCSAPSPPTITPKSKVQCTRTLRFYMFCMQILKV